MAASAAPMKGRIVSFVVAETRESLEAPTAAGARGLRSAPNYPGVLPAVAVLATHREMLDGRPVELLVKAVPPRTVIAEATAEVEDIFHESALDQKGALLAAARRVLAAYPCRADFDEEYTVYCVAGYSGDADAFLGLHGEAVAGFLKNEKMPLDGGTVEATLKSSIKYARHDLAVVDWDGAFLFDPYGDFESTIELFEIANLQLLRCRILDSALDERLERGAGPLGAPGRLILFRAREVRSLLREIMRLRSQSILEFQAIEKNIKLIGDWYSADLYDLIVTKFHLRTWQRNIKEKLDALEDIYTMTSENFTLSFSSTVDLVQAAGWFLLLLGYFALFFLELSR
ncbi:MAG: hypothetical protein HYY54_06310 [candidate division NC10 bacterium]|nr:hypothetical protein [candidate division NC10 bacterium]